MSIAIIYGSNGGTTEDVAEQIQDVLGLEADLIDIGSAEMDIFEKYDKMIIGTSTWGEGDLQDDWDDIFGDFEGVEFGGKTVAFFGLGDQEGYGDNFLDAMGTLHNVVLNNGGTIVGDKWSTDGYDYDDSIAVNDDGFVGLAIDEENQSDLTADRITKWVDTIKPHFK